MSPGWLLSVALLLLVVKPEAAPGLPPGLSDLELAGRAEAEFGEGVRLRQAADKARPHFRAAAGYFEDLRRRGASNPLLYRDLGNAYLLAGDLPRAVLAYRLGLRRSPLR